MSRNKLKLRIVPIALCCAIAMGFTSCMINSTLTDVPLIEQKNEVVASVGASIPMPMLIGTCAFGLTNKIALQSRIAIDTNANVSLQQSIGIYKKYTDRKKTEFYLGYMYGRGVEDTTLYTYDNVDRGPYHMFFAQYNIGNTNKSGSTTSGISFKGGFVHSQFVRNPLSLYNPDSTELLSGDAVFFSPTVFAQFGKGNIRFNIHAQLQFLLNLDVQYGISTAPFNFGMSLQYHFKPKYYTNLSNAAPNRANEELWKRPKRQVTVLTYPSNISLTTGMNLTPLHIRNAWMYDPKTETHLKYTPVITASYDYCHKPWYSFGVVGSYQRIKGDVSNIPYKKDFGDGSTKYTDVQFMYTQYYLGLRPLFHVVHMEKLHIYTGLSFGIQYQVAISDGTLPEVPIDSVVTRGIGYAIILQTIPIGMRYYITDQLGVTAELAIGQPYFFATGVMYRFK
jgi:hypothetical protein